MNYNELFETLEGETGTIYVARKGTVLVFCIEEGKIYLISTLAANGKVIENPQPSYWTHSIDFSGGFSLYFTYGIIPSENMPYPAEPLILITDKQMEKLKRRKNG